MKVISLIQPWASLLAIGAKRFETRSWRTPYRGLIAIHASRRFPVEARMLCRQDPFASALAGGGLNADALPLGAIIAVAQLVDCVPTENLRPQLWRNELAFGNFEPGRYAWDMQSPVRLPAPIPAKGKLWLWNWEPPDDLRKFLAIATTREAVSR